ncbi:hypothetical protein ABTN33_19990, partial [Acinetobacter baumannii]
DAVTDLAAFDAPAVRALIVDEVRRINAGLPAGQRIGELRLLRTAISLDHALAGPDAGLARHLAGRVSGDDASVLRV